MFKRVRSVADSNAKGIAGSLTGIGRNVILLGGVVLGVRNMLEGAFRGVKLFAEMEATSAAFEVLIGNADLAKKTLADLQRFALETPFQLPELLEASKMMIAFGEEADNLVPTIKILGEVSAGLQLNLKDLAYIFGTLKAQGRAFTIDIRQFAMRGIPIYLELAKVLGLVGKEAKKVPRDVMDALSKMIEKGDIDFDVVEKAFKNMTGPGGKFFGQLEAQMKTLPGMFNMMKEEIDMTLRTLGGVIVEGFNLREVIKQVSIVSEAFNKWLQNLTPETKRAIVTIASLVGIFLVLTAVVTVLGIVFAAVFSWAGGIALALTAALGAVYLWVDSVGGLGRAWKIVKRTAMDFWNFVKPMLPLLAALFFPIIGPIVLLIRYWEEITSTISAFWRAVQPILRALWSLIKTVAFAVRDILVDAFNRATNAVMAFAGLFLKGLHEIFKDSKITWEGLRNQVRNAIFAAEYLFRNFDKVVELTFFKIALNLVYLKDQFLYVFKVVLPVLLLWFVDVWGKGFTGALEIGKQFVTSLINMLKEGVANLPDIIAGKFDFAKALKTEFETFKVVAKDITDEVFKAPIIPKFEASQEEKDLANLVARLGKELAEGLNTFRRQKVLGFLAEDVAEIGEELGEVMSEAFSNLKEVAAVAGTDSGTVFMEHFSAAAKFDAALFGSAEATTRMEQFRDALLPQRERERARSASFNQPANAPAPNAAELETVELMKKLVENTGKLVGHQVAPLVPAALPP